MAVCRHCGKEFTAGRTSKGIYCSKKCYGANRKGRAPETQPNYKSGKITLYCKWCGDAFQMWPSQARDSGGGQPRQYCSRKCTNQARSREGSQWWKGGRHIGEDGYVYIYLPGHHLASKNGNVAEHRLIAEQVLGRPLRPEEVVHHDDEVRSNNHPSNLVVLSGHSEHMTLHQKRRQEAR